MGELRRKKHTESLYYHPINQVFNQKKKRYKGGGKTLAKQNAHRTNIENYRALKGLSAEEMKCAMHEIRLKISWEESSIYPKNDVSKQLDYEQLISDHRSRNSEFGF